MHEPLLNCWTLFLENHNHIKVFSPSVVLRRRKNGGVTIRPVRLFPLGSPGWGHLGGGREVASTAAYTGWLQIHQKPGCYDLGHRDAEKPQCYWRRNKEEERRSAQTASLTKQTQNRTRYIFTHFPLLFQERVMLFGSCTGFGFWWICLKRVWSECVMSTLTHFFFFFCLRVSVWPCVSGNSRQCWDHSAAIQSEQIHLWKDYGYQQVHQERGKERVQASYPADGKDGELVWWHVGPAELPS